MTSRLIAIVSSIALGACTTPALHSSCNGLGSCGDEMLCHQTSSGSPGTCEMPCQNDGDCAMGFHCDTNSDVAGLAHVCVAR